MEGWVIILDSDADGVGDASEAGSDRMRWTDRIRQMVSYHAEALDFVHRAEQHNPTISFPSLYSSILRDRVLAVLRLWVEADELDEMVLSLLSELNTDVMQGKGSLEATRGVEMRPTEMGSGQYRDRDRNMTPFYECVWSISWAEGRSVSVHLATRTAWGNAYSADVRGARSLIKRQIAYPMKEGELKDMLVMMYTAETIHTD